MSQKEYDTVTIKNKFCNKSIALAIIKGGVFVAGNKKDSARKKVQRQT